MPAFASAPAPVLRATAAQPSTAVPVRTKAIDHRLPVERERQARLDENWIGEERKQRADVGDGVQRIGRAIGVASREPGLDQGPRRRQHEEGQRDVDEEDREDRDAGFGERIRLPSISRKHGKGKARPGDDERVEDELHGGTGIADQEMGVGIAQEESGLIEGETESPDAGSAPEPREDTLADQGLNQEEQERRGEDGAYKRSRVKRIRSARSRGVGHRRSLSQVGRQGIEL